MRHPTLVIVATVLCGVVTSSQQAPLPGITYEAFCGKSRMEKQDALKTLTTEQKAMLWRTQIERWRAANAARLSVDQRLLLDEFQAIIPLAVERPRPAGSAEKLDALERRLAAAFSKADLDAMDNYGPCLAKVK
jgi:hypothetical protein